MLSVHDGLIQDDDPLFECCSSVTEDSEGEGAATRAEFSPHQWQLSGLLMVLTAMLLDSNGS